MKDDKVNRRDFMKTAALGAAAAGTAGFLGRDFLAYLPRARAQTVGAIPIDSAIVIGAGISGLTAAALLTDMGKQVTVIESCHIPGGRVQQSRFENGQHASVAGSEWFDCDVHFQWLVEDYLGFTEDEIGVWSPDTFFYRNGQYCYCTGSWLPCINHCLPTNPAHLRDYARFSGSYHDCILLEPWDLYSCYLGPRGEEWDKQDYFSYLSERYDADFADMIGNNWLKAELGVPPEMASESIGNLSFSYWYNDNCYSLKAGNHQIIEALVARLPADSLILDSPVKSVENTPTGVEVKFQGGRMSADVAIVAVPHTKVAEVVPELPAHRVAMLQNLYDTHNILAQIQFSERFWATQFGMYGWGGCADWLTVVDGTMFQALPEGILECYILEPQSRELWQPCHGIHVRDNHADNIVNAVLAKLDEFWPASQYYNGEAKVFQWIPYIPNYPPGFVRDGHYAQLRDPIDNIHFAGDYVYGPSLEAAVHRGIDVADQFA